MKCRYEVGPCTFPKLRRHFKCQDGSCPEQYGRLCSRQDEDGHDKTPALPEKETEEVIMPRPIPKPLGTCPECKREGQKLYVCRHKPDGKRYCSRCSAKFAYRAKTSGKSKAKEETSAKKTAPLPAQAKGTGLSFMVRVTLEPGLSVESAVEILRALPAGAVLVG